MRLIIHALVGLLAAAPLAGQDGEAPQCRASLDDERLVTTIRFADGTSVEGPWRVVGDGPAALENGRTGMRLLATLDRIVEIDRQGRRTPTSFPDPIRTTFEARDEQHLVEQAAQVWCLTVLKVQSGSAIPFNLEPRGPAQRITKVAR